MVVDSLSSDIKSSSIVFRPCTYRSSLPKSFQSEGVKESHRTAFYSTTMVSKLISDVRRSMTHNKLFKSFNKRHYTNEVEGRDYAYCIFFLLSKYESMFILPRVLNNNNSNN